MKYRDYIENKKTEWIGKKVMYQGVEYDVVDVDYNGGLLINKPTYYTESYTSPTTAIETWMIDSRKEKGEIELKQILIKADNFRDHAIGIADLGDRKLVLEMNHGYCDLYLKDRNGNVIEELDFENPSKKSINLIARRYGVEFV